ncbi:thioredoxin domain-containing protein [Georgenia sp. MJ173]|uniref:thioredoxin family protein n=1 Tax=Georgenia sunbinii TaxID=3117728 RepID=UPI002F266E02
MGRVRAVTDDEFDDVVLAAAGAVVVDFWAGWCAPCMTMAAVVTELAHRFGDRLTFVTVDVDAAPLTTARYGVVSIPTFVVVRDGELEAMIVGARPKPTLLAELEPFAA